MKKNFTLKFLRIRIRNRAHARARTRILMFLTCTIICDINASQHGADLEGPVLIHMYTLFYAHVFIIPIRSYYIYTYCNSLLLCALVAMHTNRIITVRQNTKLQHWSSRPRAQRGLHHNTPTRSLTAKDASQPIRIRKLKILQSLLLWRQYTFLFESNPTCSK